MTDRFLSNRRIHVVGATRGLGRGITEALASAGARVLAIGRNTSALSQLSELANVDVRRGDATDPTFVSNLLDDDEPDDVVLVAGARPAMMPLDQYGWEAFCAPWDTDVRLTFEWLRQLLRRPRANPRRAVVFSSGAALHGSPLSGGYAGAKQTQRYLCNYARREATMRELPLTVCCILPQLNPNTELGAAGVRAYARQAGQDPEAFVRQRFGDTPLSPSIAGEQLVRLLDDEAMLSSTEFLLGGRGLKALEG